MRVADLPVGETKVRVIGDPHLGRVFKTGVSLDRRGEREEMVWATFAKALRVPDNEDVSVVIIMGDIFEKMHVPNSVVLRAAALLNQLAEQFLPHVVVIRGNHDASRDTSIKSSFDVLMKLCPRVTFVTDFWEVSNEIVCFGWHPFITASEMVQNYLDAVAENNADPRCHAVFGHWDVAGDSTNLVPAELLSGFTERAVTGHDHTPREMTMKGLKVTVVGSMQPYSHAEDPDGDLYVTLTSEEYAEIDKASLFSKNVRVLVGSSDPSPEPCDCLSFVTKSLDDEEEAVDMSVSIDNFDMLTLFKTVLVENEVPAALQAEIIDRYQREVIECSGI